MKTVKYASKEYWDAVMRCDVHEYIDGCGVGWYVANDFSLCALMPDKQLKTNN